MQYFSYTIFADLIDLAESYFPTEYIAVIRKKHTYEQSLVGRYMVSEIVEKNWGISGFLPAVDSEGKPASEGNIFWSISHSGDHVFAGVSDYPIGVDIEVIRPRDESLFSSFSQQEWDIIGEKNWESFYVLWSAKEVLVKKYLGGLDDIGKWQLLGIETTSNGVKKLTFSDGNRLEGVCSEIREGVVRSWSV